MCDKAVLENGGTFKSVPDCCKINSCVIKLLAIILMHYNFFLNIIRLKKCVIKLLILMLLQVNMFLINLRLKKMCDKASDKFHFVFHSVSNQYKTQRIFDKIVSDDLFKLKHCHDRYKI